MEEIKNLPPLPDDDYKAKRKFTSADVRFIVFVVETAVVIILAVTVILLILALKADEKYLSAESSRVYEYYGERDVINLDDPVYGDIWLDALTDVPRHSLDYRNVKIENGFKNYYSGGQKINKTGIDVSYHQGNINWAAVKAAGVDFAILRIGYRGYETGKINKDPKFEEYYQGAKDAGIEVGAYFYSQAVTPEEAAEEAQFLLKILDGRKLTYPVVFDWEMVGDDSARTNDITVETLNECASSFCNTVARGGYIPMIYSVKRMALMKLDLSELAGFDFWLAEYRDEPEFPYEFQMWQYASDGKVDGIEGEVDLNMSFVDYTEIRR